jgi:hypothetical protein
MLHAGIVARHSQDILICRDPLDRADERASSATMVSVGRDEVDEQLAMLCHMELAGGEESLADTISGLPRAELERLLAIAVVELMDAKNEAEREVARMARRLQERRSRQ